MASHDTLTRLRELLDSGPYSLRHIVDENGQTLILTHLVEGWRVRATIGVNDIIPSGRGDPPIALYNKLLHAADVKRVEQIMHKFKRY